MGYSREKSLCSILYLFNFQYFTEGVSIFKETPVFLKICQSYVVNTMAKIHMQQVKENS